MNQFVPYFLNRQRSPHGRVADAQKCIRAGGKHNDLDDVGYDCHHHTFFEMLGNWSFGDYFKEEAIRWAWELLVEKWQFPKKRLMATVYRPLDGEPASEDKESYAIWFDVFKRAGLDPLQHITFGGAKDNFWMMGDSGPCGPCTEIHMDLSENGDGGLAMVNGTSSRSMELWNLVFIQYNAMGAGNFEKLSSNYVDTGMGLERIAGIWAETDGFRDFSREPSNYGSCLFAPLLERIVKLSGRKISYGRTVPVDRRKPSETELIDCAFRAVCDHIRALTLAMADGIFPGNEGRNYVLRRILRRAVLFGRRLDLRGNFLAELADVCSGILGGAYGNLADSSEAIRSTLIREQEAFERTMDRGLILINEAMGRCGGTIPGDIIFELHDTYGFPVDLSQLIAAERNIAIDIEGFERAMGRQREMARKSRKVQKISVETDSLPPTQFIGYDAANCRCESDIIAVVAAEEKGCFAVTAQTPFYGEMGGQCGDSGTMALDGCTLNVVDTRRGSNGVILHLVEKELGDESIGKRAILQVDMDRRRSICAHHTATHIMQAALRKILGPQVVQAGSSVDNSCLRFDFTHFRPVSGSEIDAVESEANRIVRKNVQLRTTVMDYGSIPSHCLAHFDERYGDTVRMVEIGDTAELCGGTHVGGTGEIGVIKILSENGIAAGIRRITAICGEAAYGDYAALAKKMALLRSELGGGDPLEALASMSGRLKSLERAQREQSEANRQREAAELATALRSSGGGRCWLLARPQDVENLRSLGRDLQRELAGDDVLMLLADGGDRWNFCAVGGPQCANAAEMAKNFAAAAGGGGGGRGNFAGGTVPKCCGEKDLESNGKLTKLLSAYGNRISA
jgi:alanyl-tRNA synthetase